MKNKSDHIPDAEKMIPLTLEQLKQIQPERPILVLTRCIDEITGEPDPEDEEFEIWDGRCFANADTYDTLENYGKRFLAYPYVPDHFDRNVGGDNRVLTNADRIRAMSDEELAREINRMAEGEKTIRHCRNLPECDDDLARDVLIPLERCEQCVLHWLRQPAKED